MTFNAGGSVDRRRFGSALTLLCVCLLGGVSARYAVAQVTSNTIAITSPGSGTIVTPGQSLQVSVSVAAGTKFTAVQVIGEDIGISLPLQTPPFSFVLVIPNSIIGPKEITAMGITGPDNGVFSQPVTVDVEVETPLTHLSVSPPRISFGSVGDQVNLTVLGKFSDGTELAIGRSSNTTYETEDAAVASVSPDGVVTAAGAGTTGIFVKYGDQLVPVPVSVRVSFAGTVGTPNCHGQSVSALAQQYGGLAAAAKALGYTSVQALQDAIRSYCGG